MRHLLRWAWICVMGLTVLTACGGGGGNPGDVFPDAPRAPSQAVGLDRFLVLPNPLVRADGVFETDSDAYAKAYYEAIDPLNAKDTLTKWKLANNFGVTGAGHVERQITVGDQRDLGYGRRITAHQNPDGTMAFLVENFLAYDGWGYSPLNLEAAARRVSQWHVASSAIEFSPGPKGPANASFAKFYAFDPATGQRRNRENQDGRGGKALPAVCITCHGGRADPLTPPDANAKALFPLVASSFSQHRGDVLGGLQLLEPASLAYSSLPGLSRAELEPAIKAINKMVLCSYPLPTDTDKTTAPPEDQCRRVAQAEEYQGTAATHLKSLYGGDGLPNPVAAAQDSYVEPSFAAAGQSSLYQNVHAPTCRMCHRQRGDGSQSDIDLETFAHFDSFKDRIKTHVVDRGTMPMAELVYSTFWSTPRIFQTMADYLLGDFSASGFSGALSDGALKPGRPIADPGPNRVVRQGPSNLSAAMSLYASSYSWTLLSGPADGAVLTNAESARPTFTASRDGTYVLQLVVRQAGMASKPEQLTVVVDNSLPYSPSELRFADIKEVLQNPDATAGRCNRCHQPGGNGSRSPPVWFTSHDRSGTGNDAINDHWFYTELRGNINFTDIAASPLLRKAAGQHHNAGRRAGFDDRLLPGAAERSDYDKILNWILIGAPE